MAPQTYYNYALLNTENISTKRNLVGIGDFAQWVIVIALKPGKLNWTPRIHMVDKKGEVTQKSCPSACTCMLQHTHDHTYMQYVNKYM